MAPGDSGASHAPQVAPTKGAPQFEQNFPVELAPQAEQRVTPLVAGGEEAMP
ncbi:MAG TPA: hypothetical protein VIP11_15415 [Gemmatimonadaceae bacterium]